MRADKEEQWQVASVEFFKALERWTPSRIDGVVAWLQVRLLLERGGTFKKDERWGVQAGHPS